MSEMRVLSPTGSLGYGFPIATFQAGMACRPHVIAADSGSTDAGPYYLGSGKSHRPRALLKRDLEILLGAAREAGIPLIVGTAGTAGGEPHLEMVVGIVREVAREQGLHFRLAVIHAEQDKAWVLDKLAQGKARSFPGTPELTSHDVESCTRIVAQMGVGPFVRALEQGAEVIIAGRSCDTALFAALPILRGFDPGLALHMAKIVECGAQSAVPFSPSDCCLAYLHEDSFILDPLNPKRRFTPVSVAAHSLYEQGDPYLIYEPNGVVDLYSASYEQVDERRVRVSGARFRPYEGSPTLKLEGAAPEGFRTIAIGGVRDPILISQIDQVKQGVMEELGVTMAGKLRPEQYRVRFRLFGKDAVMGEMDPERNAPIHEIGLVVDVVAESQEVADIVCSKVRGSFLHYDYEGCLNNSGNVAFPYSPVDTPMGQVYRFGVYHLVEVDDPAAHFPIDIEEL